MSRKALVLVGIVVACAIGLAVAAVSWGGDAPPSKPPVTPAAQQRYGDSADLMRRLERKKLMTRTTAK